MEEVKAFASLTSGLLARKGAARPAMRPQVASAANGNHNLVAVEGGSDSDDFADDLAAAQEDLGWNDHGEDEIDSPFEDAPEVLRQREELQASFPDADEAGDDGWEAEHAAPIHLTPMSAPGDRSAKGARADFAGGRRAAFTLRVDNERHLRLRLACTLQNRSAQQVVTEALDRLLDEMPGLEDLARRVRRH